MLFTQIKEAAANDVLISRVMIGMLRVGTRISREEDPTTEGFSQRVQFANQTFYNMDDLARRMTLIVVTERQTDQLTDEEIEETVGNNWNFAAGVVRRVISEAAV